MMLAAALIWIGAAAGQTPSAGEFLSDFTKQRDSMESMRADFVQTTANPDETEVSKGTLVYTRPKRLIFRYEAPVLAYMIDGLRVYEYNPDSAQIDIFDLEDRPESEAFYLGFESNVARLQEAYVITVAPPDNPDTHAIAVEFTPRPHEDSGDEPFFKRVRLQLRKKDLLPTDILIVNDEESQTSFAISNFAINETLPEGLSHVRVPEGTAIIENDTYSGEAPAGGSLFPAPAAAPAVTSEDVL